MTSEPTTGESVRCGAFARSPKAFAPDVLREAGVVGYLDRMTRPLVSRLLFGAALAFGVLAQAQAAAAQYYSDPEYELTPYGYRDHTGFFSHVDIGLGWATASADYAGIGKVENTGLGTAWHIAIGGSVMPRLAVHFSAFGFDTFGGEQRIRSTAQKGYDGDTTSSALGAGVTYYLPFNLYFSGAAGLAFPGVVNPDGLGRNLKPGLAARAAIGYEFWIGAYWGLGIAGQMQYLRAKDDDYSDEPMWQGLVFGPAFTATSN